MKIKNENPVLYTFQNKKLTYKTVLTAIQKIGIKKGNTIFIHSSLSTFGKIGEIRDKNIFLGYLLKAFTESIGKNGTIIMPTFSYSFCKKETYDINLSQSTVGIFTEYFRKQKNVIRTINPIFSVAVLGKKKKYFSTNLSKDSFGQNSIFGKLHKKNVKIIFFGASFQACTFIHYVEQTAKVPYRYHKIFSGKIVDNKKNYKDEYDFFVRPLNGNIEVDLNKFERRLNKMKLIKKVKIGAGKILSINANDLFIEGISKLNENPYFFLKKRPLC